YIGKALGVKDEINPKKYEDGWELQQYIYHTQFKMGEFDKNSGDMAEHPNLTSPVLAEPLINFIRELLPFTNRRKDALAMVAIFNDEEDYDPIFKDILGLDVKGLASSTFKDFLSGSMSLYDRLIRWLYKVNPKYSIGKARGIAKVDTMNKAVFIRLRKMSKNWSGTSFTLRDGIDNQEGFVESVRSGEKKVRSWITYFFSFYLTPILFSVFRPITWLIQKRIARYGQTNHRHNFNDKEHCQTYFEKYLKENESQIKAGHIIIDKETFKEYEYEAPEGGYDYGAN
ncbi:MAG: hypothetical protein HKN16_03935, partial [Saprospiraceae bacterium]|nr:hypothetical protein [Saprospiraceae bacterium]